MALHLALSLIYSSIFSKLYNKILQIVIYTILIIYMRQRARSKIEFHHKDQMKQIVQIKVNMQAQRISKTSHIKHKKRSQIMKIHHNNIIAERIKYSPILHQSKDISIQQSIHSLSKEKQHLNKLTSNIIKRSQTQLHHIKQQKFIETQKLNTYRTNQLFQKEKHKVRSSKPKTIQGNQKVFYQQLSTKRRSTIKNDRIQQLFDSFVCKSIDPLRNSPRPVIQKNIQNEAIQTVGNFSHKKSIKDDNVMIRDKNIIKKRSSSVIGNIGNEFHTRIKKKCLQKNPHLLASIIRKKNQTSNKQQLYKFVKRLISKVQNDKNSV